MSYNDSIYYFIPLDEITDEMINDSTQGGHRDTMPKSTRPIDGKIHGVIEFLSSKPIPNYMEKHKKRGYSHEKALEVISSKEWNLYRPIEELRSKYNFDKILQDFNINRKIQAFGELYIIIFQILKFKFLMHNLDYLDSEEKWKAFSRSQRFEKANESTMLELNYFYNLISKSEKDKIDKFRNIRNSIAHSFDKTYTNEEMLNSLSEIKEIVDDYFANNMVF
ncbi:hypothetical protein WAF17_12205 [Bernardetia sp. ABR2-2B]|uniref:hypothetical protein n=1 Tax=Bernardetia sp. ABR2-2B TaxID=3127472 RepID=UPI0030CB4BF5